MVRNVIDDHGLLFAIKYAITFVLICCGVEGRAIVF